MCTRLLVGSLVPCESNLGPVGDDVCDDDEIEQFCTHMKQCAGREKS